MKGKRERLERDRPVSFHTPRGITLFANFKDSFKFVIYFILKSLTFCRAVCMVLHNSICPGAEGRACQVAILGRLIQVSSLEIRKWHLECVWPKIVNCTCGSPAPKDNPVIDPTNCLGDSAITQQHGQHSHQQTPEATADL